MVESGLRTEELGLGMTAREGYVGADCARQVHVVGPKKGDPFASCERYPFVPRIVYALIRLTDPQGKSVFVPPQKRDGSVSRTTVDDDVLNVWIVLAEYALQATLQDSLSIEDGRNNGDKRELWIAFGQFADQPLTPC